VGQLAEVAGYTKCTAMAKGLGKIEWEELKEPPPALGTG
jgi:hypothetical protein